MNPDPRKHDSQEGPTMQQVRRARAEAFEAGQNRTPEEQRKLEEQLAIEFALTLRPGVDDSPKRDSRRIA